jgi:hypothetical protein
VVRAAQVVQLAERRGAIASSCSKNHQQIFFKLTQMPHTPADSNAVVPPAIHRAGLVQLIKLRL